MYVCIYICTYTHTHFLRGWVVNITVPHVGVCPASSGLRHLHHRTLVRE